MDILDFSYTFRWSNIRPPDAIYNEALTTEKSTDQEPEKGQGAAVNMKM